ncbi:peptidoglycan-binding domain-containing protein [Streptomyces catenulae]|uniref:Peptidoglycan-binding domain-containing protein n=1 Tax=Streptomyces catenulae TaxID=66875 RepID=A0ABV2YTE3_9ACTN|nr:peptidoglycan-binding domain-containing protein [Streptomyces catenulae]
MARPQIYPKADAKSQWFQTRYPGATMNANVGVIHTTEGTDWPSYGGGASAPTLTAKPDFKAKKLLFRQHFPIDKSARALVNLRGGTETNTLNAFQIELTGTCDPSTHAKWTKAGYAHIYWPEAPDWALRGLGELFAWLDKEHGIPLKCSVKFLPYPKSYGSAGGQRLSARAWQGYYGWLGHQHVPENSHGDPGNFPIAKVLAYAKGTTPPKTPTPSKPTSRIAALSSAVKPGGRHSQVRDLQQLLIKAGYGPIKGAVTDFYGVNTQGAVARFHDRNPKYKSIGLVRDPRIGPSGFVALQKMAGRR